MTTDNVIYHDFRKTKRPTRITRRTKPTGVFIKPSRAEETIWAIQGNVSGLIASYIAFHPEFSPSRFGQQVREELGIITANDTGPEAA